MHESASIELDPSMSGQVASREPEKAQTLPAEPPRTQAIILEGILTRKHELEPAGKKASNRLVSVTSLYYYRDATVMRVKDRFWSSGSLK